MRVLPLESRVMTPDRKSPADYLSPGPEPKADGVRFKICPICGQVFDMQILAQVYHHDGRPHVPMQARS